MIVEEIHRIVEEQDIPVVGMAPASRMSAEPSGYRPQDLLPGAQGMVCFGVPIPRSIYTSARHAPEVICRAQNLLYRRLDSLALRLAAFLEKNGEQAIPIFGCFPLEVNGRGEVAGYLNLIRMGEAAGIGVIGRNGLLLHSRYGARLMLGGVVTTAGLPEERFSAGEEPGCPADCRICAEECPAHAISIEERKVQVMRCLAYSARTPLMSRLKFVVKRALRRDAAAELLNHAALDEHTLHVCSRCVSLCPYGGEA